MWVADKCDDSDWIRLDAADIDLTTQWYENIPIISGSDPVYIFYCDNPPQVQCHTQIEHGKISTTNISGTAERHTSAINIILSPSESLHGNDL